MRSRSEEQTLVGRGLADSDCMLRDQWDWIRMGSSEGWDGEGGEKGRFRMGNTYTPMADSCECMAKATVIL